MASDSVRGQPPQAASPAWLRAMVVSMDEAIPVPGTSIRIGLDPILGLVAPGVGDGISAVTHLALLLWAFRARVPRATLLRMAINAGVDAAIGAIPVLGDVFDVGFKANRRNLMLLERTLERGSTRASAADYAFLGLAFGIVALALLIPLLVAAALFSWLARPS